MVYAITDMTVFPTIDVALAERLIASQFPHWAHLAIRPVDSQGWDNRTFRLGADMAIRLPSAQRYADQVAKEQSWLPKLAPHLPLPIPVPLAMGAPGESYPWHWSIYRWLDGVPASRGAIADRCAFAGALGEFLAALQRIDAREGPPAGRQSFYRGASLAAYDDETRRALAILGDTIDAGAAHAVWETALATQWTRDPVWFHGDVAATNLLVKEGALSAVIDFGVCGVGDPASDLAIAWTFFDGDSRAVFRSALPLDPDTWARGRGWTLWKALIVLAGLPGTNPAGRESCRTIIDAVLADHRAA